MLKLTMKQIIIMALFCISYAADVHAPKPFKAIMDDATGKEWTPNTVSAIENRAHVVFIDNTGSYCLKVGADISGGLSVGDLAPLKDGTATYSEVLRSMFQILDLNTANLATDNLTGTYTIHPELASYYAIDVDAGFLTVRDKSSLYHPEQSTSAYLVFTINEGTGSAISYTLKASSRYVYNSSNENYEMDASWSGDQWVILNSDMTITLTNNSADATNWTVADSQDLIDVVANPGSDFNPQSTTWQSNSFAAYPTNNNGETSAWDYYNSGLKTNQFYNNVDDDYQNQLGHSETASSSASAVLDIIEQNLANSGLFMRYSKDTYIAFREGLLGNQFQSIDMYNSVLDERTVEHVYFTSSYDSNGEYHPFMVIATHNAPSGPQFLIDVARPPGDGTPGTSYAEQTVTRNAVLEQKLIKIPIRDYGLVTNLTDNDLTDYGSLATDQNVNESGWDVDNHTSTSSTGVAVDGVIIYPASNNVLIYASLAAEITSTGIHVGRGMGFHYHADGHGFNSNGINLYNITDYVGHSHPPIIGFVFDGIALFGRHESNYSNMDGAAVDLDEYGGHTHDDYGYHYHAFSEEVTQQSGPNSYTFQQNFIQRGAFKGLINDIPGFLNVNTNQFMDSEIKQYVGASGTSQLKIKNNEFSTSPDAFSLHQNYPNPFNPSTNITYDLSIDAEVRASIINTKGQVIKILVNGWQSYGKKSFSWDATNSLGQTVSAGVYIIVLDVGSSRALRKMVLLK